MNNEKREVILAAVLRLIATGRPLLDLKVSEIAAEAGIGKGTIYEYFATKDELLSEAVTYGIRVEIGALRDKTRQSEGFVDRFYSLLINGEEYAQRSISFLRLFAPELRDKRAVHDFRVQSAPVCEQIIGGFLQELLQAGCDEGLFSVDDPEYGHFVLFSIVNGYLYYSCNRPVIDRAKARNDAYLALVKALR